jgi:predicted nucleic acid-binding protein
MSAKLEFVDTNILLYAYDNTNPEKLRWCENLKSIS